MPLVFEERVLTDSIYEAGAPRVEIPKLIDLSRAGKLKLDAADARLPVRRDQRGVRGARVRRGRPPRRHLLIS